MTDTESKTYHIPESRISELKTRLDRIVKKANKLGVEAASYSVGKPVDVPYISVYTGEDFERRPFKGSPELLRLKEEQGVISYVRFYPVEVSGPKAVLSGWEFVGKIMHLTDDNNVSSNVINVTPSYAGEAPDRFRHADAGNCDHCKQKRNRKDSFIVINVQNQEWKQVGSTCLKDFCGGNDPKAVAASLEFLISTNRECSDFEESETSRKVDRYSLREFLAVTAAVIRTNGWLSKSKACFGERPTADIAWEILVEKKKEGLPVKG